jgi:UDP-hydrolysing UDP-N-acetyl-D-glucosamine 2-epimerase
MQMKPKVAVLTTARSEFYQLGSTLGALARSSRLEEQLFVGGSHLSNSHGRSVRDIVNSGFSITERLPFLVDDDSGQGAALTAGLAVQVLGGALARHQTDLLVLAGDRYETLAAALAATCAGVPIAHIHGGEVTAGAIDDACRHAITKLSALHFVATDVYRERVLQMGEPADRVFDVGAPFLDQILATTLLDKTDMAKRLGLSILSPMALVAYHPVTRADGDDGMICQSILRALAKKCKTIIMTAPNSDPGRDGIVEAMNSFRQNNKNVGLYENLGSQQFLSLMALADVMVGNSSSGIHEAISFSLPVVNVGERQAGRLSPRNVVHCTDDEVAIDQAVSRVLAADFEVSLQGVNNPYGDGRAGEKIIAQLEKFAPRFKELICSPFVDSRSVQEMASAWGNDR